MFKGIVIILALMVCYLISLYNGLIHKMNAVEQSRSGIEVALTKRYDMLSKMRDVAKNYINHEKDVLAQVISMRGGMSLKEMQSADSSMNTVHKELIALAESYPELRSDSVFKELQISIRDVEDHLQAARRAYNASVTAYNNAIEMFPSSIIANARGCQKIQLFEGREESMKDVEMTF